MYSVGCAYSYVAEEKVSPKGFTFASGAWFESTSSVVRSVALWFVAPVGFVYSHLYGILLPLLFLFASAVLCSFLASFSLLAFIL